MTSEEDDQKETWTSGYDKFNSSFLGNDTAGIYEFYAVPQLVFLSVLCLAIIVGNAIVLAAIRMSKNGRHSRMNFFITHLALADLLVGVMVSMTDLASKITIEWYAGNILCKVIQFLQAMVTYSSSFILVSLSIDRYDAVARPMNFSKSGNQGRALVYSSWVISILFALPTLFIFGETIEEDKKQCWVEFPALWHWQLFFTVIAVVTFLLPAIIIAACYIAIIYIIWSKGRCLQSNGSPDRTAVNQRPLTPTRMTIIANSHATGRGIIPQAKVRTIKMTLIIVIVFILCWSPYFLYNLMDIYEHLPHNNAVSTLIQSAVPLNSAANPIIYGIFSTRVCKNLRMVPLPSCLYNIICCCARKNNSNTSAPKGYKHKNLTSQTTHLTMTTFDSNRIKERKLSPLNQTNFGTLNCNIFTRARMDSLSRDPQEKKSLFSIRNVRGSSRKHSSTYEMDNLGKSNSLQNLGNSGMEDSCETDDSVELSSHCKGVKNADYSNKTIEDLAMV